jgi:hypothetical protein
MHWPQIAMIVLIVFGLTVHITKHGEKREDRYNGFTMFVAAMIEIGLLYAGGFFG